MCFIKHEKLYCDRQLPDVFAVDVFAFDVVVFDYQYQVMLAMRKRAREQESKRPTKGVRKKGREEGRLRGREEEIERGREGERKRGREE